MMKFSGHDEALHIYQTVGNWPRRVGLCVRDSTTWFVGTPPGRTVASL